MAGKRPLPSSLPGHDDFLNRYPPDKLDTVPRGTQFCVSHGVVKGSGDTVVCDYYRVRLDNTHDGASGSKMRKTVEHQSANTAKPSHKEMSLSYLQGLKRKKWAPSVTDISLSRDLVIYDGCYAAEEKLIEWACKEVTDSCKAHIIYGLTKMGKSSLAEVLAQCLCVTGTDVFLLTLLPPTDADVFTKALCTTLAYLVTEDCFIILDALICKDINWSPVFKLLRTYEEKLYHPIIFFTYGHNIPEEDLLGLHDVLDRRGVKTHVFDLKLNVEDDTQVDPDASKSTEEQIEPTQTLEVLGTDKQ